MPEPRLALPPALPSELIEYILLGHAHPTTLLVCTSQASFVEALTASTPPNSSLLLPTLQQLATSRYITVVFVPTLTHLRAYLSIVPGLDSTKPGPPDRQWQRPGTNKPSLVVYGLLECHRYTGEWSAQGLGCSLAALVDAGRRGKRQIIVIEERTPVTEAAALDANEEEQQGEDTGELIEEIRSLEEDPAALDNDGLGQIWKGWYERVPMLSGSGPRLGLGIEDAGWSGRTVEVGRIFGRWFKFTKGTWEDLDGSSL
ncbi:hypothetical protein PVAG01_00904 [Phlyctema vagabunda]|uniref:Uncharacterized protein n=1 Tax=Phlyctema vagabunda TaxID=108571 RepID=A0ABR4PVK6_9HELO